MILSALGYVNKRLYMTPNFFKDKSLKRLFGGSVEPKWINDDALSRILNAIYKYGVSELYEQIALKAMDIHPISKLHNDGLMETIPATKKRFFEANVLFARRESIIPAPEVNHAVKGAIDEAINARKEGKTKTALICFSGTWVFLYVFL